MSHLRAADGTVLCDHDQPHEPQAALQVADRKHSHDHEHEHSQGLVDHSILRSRAGIRAVSWSLGILTVTALAQAFVYARTLSVALLAALIHSFGDALTAIPLGLAFFLRPFAARSCPASPSSPPSSSAHSSHSAKQSSASFTRTIFPISGCSLLPA